MEIALAALKLGAVSVPLNYRLRRGEIRFTDALPVNASGKILKRELRTRD